MKWEASVIPIIVAFVTVTIGPFLSTFLYSELFTKPIISATLLITNDEAINNETLKIFNNGSAPATNLTLILKSPKEMVSIINNISSTRIALPYENTTLSTGMNYSIQPTSILEIEIPKLVHGAGSVIELQIKTKARSGADYNPHNYLGTVSYDQGSVLVNIENKNDKHDPIGWEASISDIVYDWWLKLHYIGKLFLLKIGGLANFLLLYVVLYIVVLAILLKYYRPILKKRRFFKRLKKQVMIIRQILKQAPDSNISFIKYIKRLKKDGTDINNRRFRFERNALMYIDMKDYALVDDLYLQLLQREKNLNSPDLQKNNQDLLIIIDKLMNEISWQKYV